MTLQKELEKFTIHYVLDQKVKRTNKTKQNIIDRA